MRHTTGYTVHAAGSSHWFRSLDRAKDYARQALGYCRAPKIIDCATGFEVEL
jgi:hypothetical protein